ncbi:MAG: PAS domain S-box protein [Dehalococcoidales bacterium]|nr:PAS domain S-box protein [Dehalococcoidales bacterium]
MKIRDNILASAVASTVSAIIIVDFDGRITYVNDSFLKMLGYASSTEIVGHSYLELCQFPMETEKMIQTLQKEGHWVGELASKKKDGSPFIVELSASLVKDESGKFTWVMACFTDVTDRRKIEQSLNESIRFTASLLNNYQHPIIVINPDTSIRYVNPAVETLTGFSVEELIGLKPPYPWLTSESLPRTEHDFQIAMKRGKVWFEEQYHKKNGDLFWVEITSVPVKHDVEPAYLMTSWVDITERKQMEAELKREKDLADTYLNIVGVMVAAIDLTGKITMINRRGYTLLGYEQDELPGKNWFSLLIPAKSRREIRKTMSKLTTGVVDSINHYECSLVAKNGQEKRITSNYILLKDSSGKDTGILISGEDITEMRKAQEQLQHSRLMVTLGEMTAGIAHEVNNPLGSILLYSELLMAGEDVPPQIKKDLKVIHDEAKRAAKIMTDLLTYGRQTKPYMRRVNLHSLLDKVLRMRKYQQKMRNITVSTNYSSGPLYVTGNAAQLVNVFMNIILNAEEALRGYNNGKIIVATQLDSKWAKVIIADNGQGIPDENISQVFYPFFSTKPTGEGTGLGLSTSYGVITSHNGLIRAENNEMGGATFVVELPVVQNSPRNQRRQNDSNIRA